ncbi:hypothetical protein E2C01_046897 [Portunus trituberculatus]|uniref:Uncharacterized protein n=1 Tax=Portunus trituberculatus TaxID=210409 RepID=A0A5B7G255_PORTR|nr:hypothetical protein [Portunus trituberculatus]
MWRRPGCLRGATVATPAGRVEGGCGVEWRRSQGPASRVLTLGPVQHSAGRGSLRPARQRSPPCSGAARRRQGHACHREARDTHVREARLAAQVRQPGLCGARGEGTRTVQAQGGEGGRRGWRRGRRGRVSGRAWAAAADRAGEGLGGHCHAPPGHSRRHLDPRPPPLPYLPPPRPTPAALLPSLTCLAFRTTTTTTTTTITTLIRNTKLLLQQL